MKSLDSALPITVGTVISRDLLESDSHFSSQCDWIELRLDHLHPEKTATAPLSFPKDLPILLTARGPEEGGANSLSLAQRAELLSLYLKGATAVDIEAAQLDSWQTWLEQARSEHEFALVASHHDFHRTPSLGECEGIIEQAFTAGADLVKFAFHLESLSDMQLGLDLLSISFPGPISVMGMGPLAPVSRLLYAQHGSRLNYGFLGEVEAAPGQWPARVLKEAISHLQRINPTEAPEHPAFP